MILLTGATGSIGLEVAKLLSSREVPFRAMVRNPKKADALKLPGAELVQGDFTDAPSLASALASVKSAFLLAPPVENLDVPERAFIDAAKSAGVRHIVNLSAVGAKIGVPHRFGDWHGKTEAYLAKSGMGWTLVRPNFFMQNLLGMAGMVKGGTIYAPTGNGKSPFVDVRDIAAVVATCLTEPGHEGKTYEVSGPEDIGYEEMSATFSKVLGKSVAYVDVPPENAAQSMLDMGMPSWLPGALNELNLGMKENRFAGVTDIVKRVGKKDPISFAQFVRDHISAFN